MLEDQQHNQLSVTMITMATASVCTLISVTNVTDRPSMCQYCASLAVNFLSWVAAALTGQPNTPAAGHLAWACLPRSLVTRQHGHEKLFRWGVL